jgi:hypothetical protein
MIPSFARILLGILEQKPYRIGSKNRKIFKLNQEQRWFTGYISEIQFYKLDYSIVARQIHLGCFKKAQEYE